ncbi:hypothetical protein TNCV_1013791 [Trichonephila clavipes]|uniref:Uncharacterized protein n=1 Tax=Trichonephila clavipes TaxID=2585209 RepID=A0A8X7B9L5_TRICX|nr:hypothetical protein TNCV_1013791 [Trichonephila clavipes]
MRESNPRWRTALVMSSRVSNRLPRIGSLILGMRSKSQDEISGEYDGQIKIPSAGRIKTSNRLELAHPCHRTWGRKPRIAGANRLNSSRWEEDDPDERIGQLNARICGTVVELKKPARMLISYLCQNRTRSLRYRSVVNALRCTSTLFNCGGNLLHVRYPGRWIGHG